MPIQEKIRLLIQSALQMQEIHIPVKDIILEHPQDSKNGDISTNVAMKYSHKVKMSSQEFAKSLILEMKKNLFKDIMDIKIAGSGFINFWLNDSVFINEIKQILEKKDDYARQDLFHKQKTIVEYTDPNPFKELHIGHLMSNTIGESISRILQFMGAEIKRANYQGDVGMHVAKAVWGILQLEKEKPKATAPLNEKAYFLGQAYSKGAMAYNEDEETKVAINILNKKIFERSDEEINRIYDESRKWSLDYFETIYELLGTKFDFYFFESDVGKRGKEIVLQHGNIFEESQGAIVFRGEKYGLHTRVFINSEGLPTYEAKELGLSIVKHEVYPYDRSIVITGNEIVDYFKVLLQAMSLIYPEIREKTEHIAHGMLRLSSGKMSSRTGDVLTAESLIKDVSDLILEKMAENDIVEKNKVANIVAVGAIKYSMLKQDIGRDIIFDFEKSLSFSGDSGPYLQYTYARCSSIIYKAQEGGILPSVNLTQTGEVERLLFRFPEVVQRSAINLTPHIICTYLHNLAQAFNSYYAKNKIISEENSSAYRVALTIAVAQVLKTGLNLLGIQAPSQM